MSFLIEWDCVVKAGGGGNWCRFFKMLPLAPNLAAASAFMLMLLASSASGRALDGGDSAEEEGGQEDRRMDSQVSKSN